ncbi:cytochrome P450 71D10-like [Salvia hispanica]|uniref:cytochrome P450 71D10-like n=1 Tax=Salvia hispanica TaxID=49212 RepID=UPI0020094FA2|nr:cytochrome P450 71D10-like [Salvia hispanica]
MEFDLPSTLIPLIPFLLFLFIFLKSQSISKSAKRYSHIPGPKPLPLIGNLHLMLRDSSSGPHSLFRSLAAKHGPLMHLQLGELHVLIVSSVEFAKEVMRTHDTNFANRPVMLATEEITYNSTDIVFSPYGDYWRHLRKICTVELLTARRVRSFRSIREEEVTNMCNWIASREGSTIDLSERLYMTSYDVIMRVAAAKASAEDREMMISLSMEASKLSSGFMLADLYPSIKLLPLITGDRFKIRRVHRKLDEMLDGIIEQQRPASHRGNESKVEGFIDILLKFERDGTLTADNVKAVLLDMFLAGTDTSATTVEWAMSELIRNHSKLIIAQQEVRKVFDNEGSYIDEDKFHELKYLKLVIKETLRLHPPAPLLIPRVNSQRCEINGYEIPAGSRVIVNGWALGRDPEYWNDAEKFMPERFEESSHDFNGSNLEYIPFGAGRRICPGLLFGLANVELPLAMLLYHFDWEMPNGMKYEELDMTEGFGVTVRKKHHLCLIPIVKRPLQR